MWSPQIYPFTEAQAAGKAASIIESLTFADNRSSQLFVYNAWYNLCRLGAGI